MTPRERREQIAALEGKSRLLPSEIEELLELRHEEKQHNLVEEMSHGPIATCFQVSLSGSGPVPRSHFAMYVQSLSNSKKEE